MGIGCRAAGCRRRVVLIGDSTVADYPVSDAPLTGWGQALRARLGSRATVINHAIPGSSTRTFASGHWQRVRSRLQNGDLLLIQFGHIDALPDPERHTEPDGLYRKLLLQFVSEAIAAGARPVLVTPVARYKFASGKLIDTHGKYLKVMREVGAEAGVLVVDLAQRSAEVIGQMGEGQARTWFMIAHDGHDEVHLTWAGANAVAAIVEAELERALLGQNVLCLNGWTG
jgi:DNA sulfur modification protein DndE